MFAEERHQQIIALLQDSKRVQAEELAISLGVSRETIRRDLKHLEDAGTIRRVHGGALLAQKVQEAPFRARVEQRTAEKRAIAKAAAALVKPGSCCFIDAGSTTAALAHELAAIPDVSVITNSIEVASILRSARPGMDVILVGGSLSREVPATQGELTLSQIRLFRADIALISPVGVDRDAGVTYFDLGEGEVAKTMLARAGRKIVLADSSKHEIVSRVFVANCAEFDVLVTDSIDNSNIYAAGFGEVILPQGGRESVLPG